jgi:hypothetical protein
VASLVREHGAQSLPCTQQRFRTAVLHFYPWVVNRLFVPIHVFVPRAAPAGCSCRVRRVCVGAQGCHCGQHQGTAMQLQALLGNTPTPRPQSFSPTQTRASGLNCGTAAVHVVHTPDLDVTVLLGNPPSVARYIRACRCDPPRSLSTPPNPRTRSCWWPPSLCTTPTTCRCVVVLDVDSIPWPLSKQHFHVQLSAANLCCPG